MQRLLLFSNTEQPLLNRRNVQRPTHLRFPIVSVESGTSPGYFNATTMPSALYAALNEQDLLCRVFGDCVAGHILDREVDNMSPLVGPLRQKLFRYVRYNAELTKEGLAALGCGDVNPEAVQKLDSIDGIPSLERVGQAAAQRQVDGSHFNLEVFQP